MRRPVPAAAALELDADAPAAIEVGSLADPSTVLEAADAEAEWLPAEQLGAEAG